MSSFPTDPDQEMFNRLKRGDPDYALFQKLKGGVDTLSQKEVSLEHPILRPLQAGMRSTLLDTVAGLGHLVRKGALVATNPFGLAVADQPDEFTRLHEFAGQEGAAATGVMGTVGRGVGIATQVGLGAIPGMQGPVLAGMVGGAAGARDIELQDRKDLSPLQRYADVVGTGAVQYLLSKVNIGQIGKVASSVVKGPGTSSAIARAIVKSGVTNIGVGEIGLAAQESLDAATGVKTPEEAWKSIKENAPRVAGDMGVVSLITGGVGLSIGSIRRKNVPYDVTDNIQTWHDTADILDYIATFDPAKAAEENFNQAMRRLRFPGMMEPTTGNIQSGTDPRIDLLRTVPLTIGESESRSSLRLRIAGEGSPMRTLKEGRELFEQGLNLGEGVEFPDQPRPFGEPLLPAPDLTPPAWVDRRLLGPEVGDAENQPQAVLPRVENFNPPKTPPGEAPPEGRGNVSVEPKTPPTQGGGGVVEPTWTDIVRGVEKYDLEQRNLLPKDDTEVEASASRASDIHQRVSTGEVTVDEGAATISQQEGVPFEKAREKLAKPAPIGVGSPEVAPLVATLSGRGVTQRFGPPRQTKIPLLKSGDQIFGDGGETLTLDKVEYNSKGELEGFTYTKKDTLSITGKSTWTEHGVDHIQELVNHGFYLFPKRTTPTPEVGIFTLPKTPPVRLSSSSQRDLYRELSRDISSDATLESRLQTREGALAELKLRLNQHALEHGGRSSTATALLESLNSVNFFEPSAQREVVQAASLDTGEKFLLVKNPDTGKFELTTHEPFSQAEGVARREKSNRGVQIDTRKETIQLEETGREIFDTEEGARLALSKKLRDAVDQGSVVEANVLMEGGKPKSLLKKFFEEEAGFRSVDPAAARWAGANALAAMGYPMEQVDALYRATVAPLVDSVERSGPTGMAVGQGARKAIQATKTYMGHFEKLQQIASYFFSTHPRVSTLMQERLVSPDGSHAHRAIEDYARNADVDEIAKTDPNLAKGIRLVRAAQKLQGQATERLGVKIQLLDGKIVDFKHAPEGKTFSSVMSQEYFDILSRGPGSKDWAILKNAIWMAHLDEARTLSDVETFMGEQRQQISGDMDEAAYRRMSMEIATNWPHMPSDVLFPTGWVATKLGSPVEYIRRSNQLIAHRLGVIKTWGQSLPVAGEKTFFNKMREAYVGSGGDPQSFDGLMRSLHNMPAYGRIELGVGAHISPSNPFYKGMKFLDSVIQLVKAFEVSNAPVANLPQLLGDAGVFGSYTRLLRAMGDLFGKGTAHRNEILNTMQRSGVVTRDMIDLTVDKQHFMSSVFRQLARNFPTSILNRVVNETLTEQPSGRTGQIMVKDFSEGKWNLGDRTTLRMMGYTEGQAQELLNAKGLKEPVGSKEHNEYLQRNQQFAQRFNAFAVGTTALKAETAPFWQTRLARFLLPWNQYFTQRLQQLGRFEKTFVQATKEGDRQLQYGTTLKAVKWVAGNAAAGAVTNFMMSGLLGGTTGLQDEWKKLWTHPFGFLKDSAVYSLFGGLWGAVVNTAFGNQGLSRLVYPVGLARDFGNAVILSGRYQQYDHTEAMTQLALNHSPFTRTVPVRNAMVMMGASMSRPEQEYSTKAYWRWRFSNGAAPAAGGTEGDISQENAQFRDVMRRAYGAAIKEEDATPYLEKALEVTGKDWNSVKSSLRQRKLLDVDPTMTQEKLDQMKADLGEKVWTELEKHDELIDAITGFSGGSHRRRVRRR